MFDRARRAIRKGSVTQDQVRRTTSNGWAKVPQAIGLLLIASCATTPPPSSNPSGSTGIIEFMDQLRLASSTALDSVTARTINRPKRTETASTWAWQAWWCPRGAEVFNHTDVQRKAQEYCRRIGGRVDQEVACVDPADPMKVLFFVGMKSGSQCAGTPTAVAYVLEPKPGQERSMEFRTVLEMFRYQPPPVREQDRLRAEQAQRNQEEAERARLEWQLPLLKTRGTRVCRTQDRMEYVGFVDDISEDGRKVRIEVKGTTSGLRPGNWQPGPIWDFPENWRVCE